MQNMTLYKAGRQPQNLAVSRTLQILKVKLKNTQQSCDIFQIIITIVYPTINRQ